MEHELTKTPRERRHDENLRKILDAAMLLVEEGGLRALSVNKLAAAVDYTPGALYRYFPSKDALLSALVARVLEELRAHFGSALELAAPRTQPLSRVVLLTAAYRAFARWEPARFGLLAMSMAEPKVLLEEPADVAPVVLAAMNAMEPIASTLESAVGAGQLEAGNAAERALCLFGLLQGVLQLHKQARHAPQLIDLDRLTAQGVRALLCGWGADPRSVSAALAKAPTNDELRHLFALDPGRALDLGRAVQKPQSNNPPPRPRANAAVHAPTRAFVKENT